MRARTIRDLDPADLDGRRALVRVDFNVPMDEDGTVRDSNRIEASVPTLKYLLEHGARPVLLSHLGRPKGEVVPRYSLAPVAPVLSTLLEAPVHFLPETDTDAAVEATEALEPGSVLLLENTRFLPGETKNEPELSRRLARLGDLYVNDAFGSTHRSHASVVGVAELLDPAVAGLLVESELEAFAELRNPRSRPFVVAFGGAKISDKIPLIEAFLERADAVLVGGAGGLRAALGLSPRRLRPGARLRSDLHDHSGRGEPRALFRSGDASGAVILRPEGAAACPALCCASPGSGSPARFRSKTGTRPPASRWGCLSEPTRGSGPPAR